MPIKNTNPFVDVSSQLRSERNPFVDKFKAGSFKGYSATIKNEALESHFGKWLQVNILTQRLFVEIGCHYGQVLVDIAKDHNDTLVLGLEITFKRLVKTADRIVSANLTNAHVILANAKAMPKIFGDQEITGVILFFPDPWPKEKQKRHRLLQTEFAKILWKCLAPGGFIWLKTDSKDYFDEASKSLHRCGFVLNYNERPALFDKDYESSFQKLFGSQGRAYYMLTAIKP